MGDKPYKIHSETRITLSPLAIELARDHGMSLTEMARHLLNQHFAEGGAVVYDEEDSPEYK